MTPGRSPFLHRPPAMREFESPDAPRPGTVYLVGAGPGDPGLLTLRAAELLAAATVVFHDYLVSDGVLGRCRAGPGWSTSARSATVRRPRRAPSSGSW